MPLFCQEEARLTKPYFFATPSAGNTVWGPVHDEGSVLSNRYREALSMFNAQQIHDKESSAATCNMAITLYAMALDPGEAQKLCICTYVNG